MYIGAYLLQVLCCAEDPQDRQMMRCDTWWDGRCEVRGCIVGYQGGEWTSHGGGDMSDSQSKDWLIARRIPLGRHLDCQRSGYSLSIIAPTGSRRYRYASM
jgi:hypothetical protein